MFVGRCFAWSFVLIPISVEVDHNIAANIKCANNSSVMEVGCVLLESCDLWDVFVLLGHERIRVSVHHLV